MRELDYGVGQIIETLKRLKIDKNTLVVFSSDNGAALYSKENGSLRLSYLLFLKHYFVRNNI